MASNVTIKARYEHESVESMLRRFKKAVEKSGVMKEMRDRTEYVKPSEKKRIKLNEAKRKARQDNLKKQAYNNRADK